MTLHNHVAAKKNEVFLIMSGRTQQYTPLVFTLFMQKESAILQSVLTLIELSEMLLRVTHCEFDAPLLPYPAQN